MAASDSYIIRTTGVLEPVVPANKRDFKLEEVQKICNDCVEVVWDDREYCMIASENAIEKGFELNPIASFLATEIVRYPMPILGDVLVCRSSMFK